jgi:hypothetical protein
MKHRDHTSQLTLPILADLTPRGDGTFVLKPRVTQASGETWIDASEAATILGVSVKTIYRLGDNETIRCRQVTPRKRQFEVGSIHEFREGIEKDPEYWRNRTFERTQ